MALERELQIYKERLADLRANEGKYALVHGDELVVFDTYEDALRIGYEKYGLDPFMVKRIESVEAVHFITRDITLCPA
jgi:hypothetical protein